MIRPTLPALALSLAASPVAAQDEVFQGAQDAEPLERVEEPTWSAEIELGVVDTSGNTNTNTSNGSALVVHERNYWRHRGEIGALRSKEEGVVTAERYTAAAKSDYKFRPRDYVFVALRYEDDRFSGYDYRASEAVGYGRKILDSERFRLDAEIGGGARQERIEDGEETQEGLGRLAGDFGWQFSETARFSQTLLVEVDGGTYTRSVTGLSARVLENLSMKLSHEIRKNTDVPADTEDTDTITSINLVYSL
jgi:putative salt-induced outer membrane protein